MMHGGWLVACDTCLAPSSGPWKPWLLLLGGGCIALAGLLLWRATGVARWIAIGGLALVTMSTVAMLTPFTVTDANGLTLQCQSAATRPGTKLDDTGQEVSRLEDSACVAQRHVQERGAVVRGSRNRRARDRRQRLRP